MKLFIFVFLNLIYLNSLSFPYLFEKPNKYKESDNTQFFFETAARYSTNEHYSIYPARDIYEFSGDKNFSLFGKAFFKTPKIINEKNQVFLDIQTAGQFSFNKEISYIDPIFTQASFSYVFTASEQNQITLTPYYNFTLNDLVRSSHFNYYFGSIGLKTKWAHVHSSFVKGFYSVDISKNSYLSADSIGFQNKNSLLINLSAFLEWTDFSKRHVVRAGFSSDSNLSQGEAFYYQHQRIDASYRFLTDFIEISPGFRLSRLSQSKIENTEYLIEPYLNLFKQFEFFILKTSFNYFSNFSDKEKRDESGWSSYMAVQFQKNF